MQDRFKFRIWDKSHKQYWEFDKYNIVPVLLPDGPKLYDKQRCCFCDEYEEGDRDRYIIEQCTGLKDKNGKLIYEGDIVDIKEHIYSVNGLYRVIYDDINHCWALKRNEVFYYSYLSFSALNGFADDCEVVGNIHENPDLLEKEDE